jgi:hypothetical protein
LKSYRFILAHLFLGASLFGLTHPTYMMPINCAELIPDSGPFIHYLQAVAHGLVSSNQKLAKRILRLIALRQKLADETGRTGIANPIDPLLRAFICFYREQKEPLKAVMYDDAGFLGFLKSGLDELEKKADDAVLQVALEEQRRKEFERKTDAQRLVIERMSNEAEAEAADAYERLNSAAKRKALLP